ncbi:MAG: ATP-binding protein [Nitrospirota bacterium]
MAVYISSIRKKIFAGIAVYFLVSVSLLIFLYIRTQKPLLSPLILAITFVALVISGIFIYIMLSRAALRPVKYIEENLKMISEGKFQPSSLSMTDNEIKSLNELLKKISVYLSHELEIRQKQLMHTEKLASLGTFLSGIAHELVNPLSNIYSSSQILLEEIDVADREYQKELLTQIEQESDRARKIARSLLEFCRDRDIKKELLPLKKLFEETMTFVSGDKPSTVEIILDIPAGIAVYADKQRIQQAFLNLMKNAIEAIPSEGKVIVNARENYGDGFVNIEICDTGVGIDAGHLSRIFDAFYTTKDVGKGSGLGLFITHEIIKENNGSIEVESRIGKGTAFLVKLPGREI